MYVAYALWYLLELSYAKRCVQSANARRATVQIELAVCRIFNASMSTAMWYQVGAYHDRCKIAKNAL